MTETAQENPEKKGLGKYWKLLNSPLIVALLPAALAYFGAVTNSNKHISYLKQELQQQITNLQTQKQTLINYESGKTLSASDEERLNDTPSRSFNSMDWTFIRGMAPNKEGYYCPQSPSFPSWAMWTKNKHKANNEISITFSLLDKTKNDKGPTLFISYGDKTSDAPDTFYRFNIFDGDLETLRLYNREGDPVLSERSVNSANLDKYITFTISPVFLNKKSPRLTLNPVISYPLDEGPTYNFEPEGTFELNLPWSSSADQGDGFHYGIGVSGGDCFKVISSSL